LPCKVIVYEQDNGTYAVAFARPEAIFTLMGDPETAPMAETVDQMIRAAYDSL
jgi:uncharacterized protein (DUF302 family)